MSLEHMESVSLPVDLSEFDSIIDVRAPSEYAEDHVPGAINLPVLDDEQRAEIGALYRQNPFEARRQGAAYVSRSVATHLEDALARNGSHWSPLLYCWRGGLRSRSFATVLRSVGWRARILEGGYKSWRRYVIKDLEDRLNSPDLQIRIIAGLTGTGKTRLLTTLTDAGAQVIDLEGLANHRGSLLGSRGKQPSQKRFETLLHAALQTIDTQRPVFCEAESARIGSLNLPPALWRRFAQAPVIELTLPRDERVKLLLAEYRHFLDDPKELASLLDPLRPLRGHKQVDAWKRQIALGEWSAFVASLLEHHYDLCYRRPGSPDSVYQRPDRRLDLQDCRAASFAAAAGELVAGESLPVP